MRFRVLFTVLLVSCHAAAGDPVAQALFQAGREAAEAKDYATACARFEESNRLEPAAGTVLNLGDCRERLGQVASAWQRYREAKDRLSPGDERIELIDERLVALEPRLPWLTITLSPDARGASVVHDGIELGAASLGLALPVDPGPQEIVIRKAGHRDNRLSFQLAEGEHKQVVLGLGPEDVSPPDAPGASSGPQESAPDGVDTSPPLADRGEDPGAGQRTLGFVVGGVGVAGVAASLVTGLMVLSEKNTVESECPSKQCASQEGIDAGDRGRTLSTVSTVAFAAGVAALGVGGYLVFSAPDGSERARLELGVSPESAAVTFGGRF